jgi:peptide/nickel transport system permease protein
LGPYVIRRLLGMIPMLLLVAVVGWVIVRLSPYGPQGRFAFSRIPTDVIDAWLRDHCLDPTTRMGPQLEATTKEFLAYLGIWNCQTQSPFTEAGGLNVLPEALGGGTNGLLHLDFGLSIDYQEPVIEVVLERLPITLLLMVPALVFAVVVAVLLGVFQARRASSTEDRALEILAYLALSAPVFWIANMLTIVFGWQLGWLPVHGLVDNLRFPTFGTDAYWAALAADPLAVGSDLVGHLIIPWTALLVGAAAIESRFVRNSLLEQLDEPYIRTAYAKGATEHRVFYHHAFRNTATVVLTRVGLLVPVIFTGSIVIEQAFAINGMGRLMLQALRSMDVYVVMGLIIVGGVIVLIVNLVTDLLYGVVDPRVRHPGRYRV